MRRGYPHASALAALSVEFPRLAFRPLIRIAAGHARVDSTTGRKAQFPGQAGHLGLSGPLHGKQGAQHVAMRLRAGSLSGPLSVAGYTKVGTPCRQGSGVFTLAIVLLVALLVLYFAGVI